METIIGAAIAATAAVGVVRLTRRSERAAWLRQERLTAYSELLSLFLRSNPARVTAAATAEDSEEDDPATIMLTAEHEHKLQQAEHRLQQAEHKHQQVTDAIEFETHALELFARIQILGPPDMVNAAVRLIVAHRRANHDQKTRSSLNDAEQRFILTANYVIGEAGWWNCLRQRMAMRRIQPPKD